MWNPFRRNTATTAAVYDVTCIPELLESVKRLEEQVADAKRRLDCIDKFGDHDWMFVEKGKAGIGIEEVCRLFAYTMTGDHSTADFHEGPYKYRCSHCGHTRGFSWIELTKDEQEALTLLGLGKK